MDSSNSNRLHWRAKRNRRPRRSRRRRFHGGGVKKHKGADGADDDGDADDVGDGGFGGGDAERDDAGREPVWKRAERTRGRGARDVRGGERTGGEIGGVRWDWDRWGGGERCVGV